MVYRFVSSREVIRRLIRNTRIQDGSYFDDMEEWMVEAAKKLKTRYSLVIASKDLDIKNHLAVLPCDVLVVYCIVFEGSRLNIGTDERDYGNLQPGAYYGPVYGYEQQIIRESHTTEDGITQKEKRVDYVLNSLRDLPSSTTKFYRFKGNYVQTSFKEGTITIHYAIAPRDDDGFWQIPDNEDYKEACYWYLRSKLIGAGWEDPKGYSEDQCYMKFEHFGGRALEQITYPSVDTMQRLVESSSRLISPLNYWESFFPNPNR